MGCLRLFLLSVFGQAVLDGRPLARNSSSPVTGEAMLNINLQKPPGTYHLAFEVMAMNEELNTNITVTVVECGAGDVEVASKSELNAAKACWVCTS